MCYVFFFQAEDGIRDLVRSRGLGDVYKRQVWLDDVKITSPFITYSQIMQSSHLLFEMGPNPNPEAFISN